MQSSPPAAETAHDASYVAPLLALASPEKRCGKTTALNVLGALVPRPLPASNVTAAALFRVVESMRPTLLVDEADSFLRDKEELRGVLNSGHARGSAVVVRTAGDDHEARVFSTWGPKAIALIGDLPDTLSDRSVTIPMRRRHPDEEVERLRLDRLQELEPLRRMASRWVSDHFEALRGADPDVPRELHDRAADNWRPLLAIADQAGGEWPDRARKAARILTGADDGDDGSVRTLLLRDIQQLFSRRGTSRLASQEIVDSLAKMEDRPWPEWGRSRRPITPTGLARLLKPFGIRPTQAREGEDRARGYDLSDLQEAFRRYVGAPTRDNRDNPITAGVSGDSQPVTTQKPVTGASSRENPGAERDVTGVTGGEGATADDGPESWTEVL